MARSSSTTRTSPLDSTGGTLAGIDFRLDVVQRLLDVVELLVDRAVVVLRRRRTRVSPAAGHHQQRNEHEPRESDPPRHHLASSVLAAPTPRKLGGRGSV